MRIIICLLIFGWIVHEARGAGAAAILLAGLVALGVNRLWRRQQHAEALITHREEVIADEDLRLAVRERRARP